MDSHDTERFLSMIANPDRVIDHDCHLSYNKHFNVSKPDQDGINLAKTILLFQFTYIGAPYIYYGDEVGMWGADDPDCRKPMLWSDMEYEPESHHPFNLPRKVDTVKVDTALFNYYKSLIELRKNLITLRRGGYKTILIDDANDIFGFERFYEGETIRAIFNLSEEKVSVSNVECFRGINSKWRLIFSNGSYSNGYISPKSGFLFEKL